MATPTRTTPTTTRPARGADRPLSQREAAFVLWFVVLDSPAEAARRAGYSAKTANVQAYQMRKSPRIAAAIEAAQAEVRARAEAAQAEVIEQAAQLAAKEALSQQYVIDVLRENIARSMQAVPVLDSQGEPTGEWRYDGGVVNGAAKLLGEHLGMFTKKVQLDARVSNPPGRLTESERDRMLREFLAEREN